MPHPISVDRINLTTLRLFVAVAEEGALNRASMREAIAPSAASKRLADLEADLSVTLFLRSSAGMSLTAAGESLLQHARRLLMAAGSLAAELSEYRAGVRGHVRMLANLSAIVAFLPEDLESFFLAHPDLRIELEERPTAGVVRGIEEGWAEIGICSGDAEMNALEARTYRVDRLAMLMRTDHPLVGRGPLPYADTLDYEQIGLHAESSIFTRSKIAAREAGRSLNRRIHVPGFDAICRTVQAGLGIALIPEPVYEILGRPMGLHIEALTDPWARRELKLVTRSDRPLAASSKALVAHLLT